MVEEEEDPSIEEIQEEGEEWEDSTEMTDTGEEIDMEEGIDMEEEIVMEEEVIVTEEIDTLLENAEETMIIRNAEEWEKKEIIIEEETEMIGVTSTTEETDQTNENFNQNSVLNSNFYP